MYGWADHVGELELHLEAASEADVFLEGLRAIRELLEEEGDGAPAQFDVSAGGADRALLLAGWLEELAFLAESEGVIPVAADDLVLEPARVSARISGRRGHPPHLVKAVTYHRLAFEPHDGGWRAVVVLDV